MPVDIDDLLARVDKPSRYLGTELNAVHKDRSAVEVRMALAFPDLYDLGLGNLGIHILYACVNRLPWAWCERVYAPAPDMEEALRRRERPLTWHEEGAGPAGERGRIIADPARWGDIILARKDIGTSYHVAVVADDALQGITHVTRGQDLFHATAVHRLLQELLDLPEPVYVHHPLVTDDSGRKLSKRFRDRSLRSLREGGADPAELRRALGFPD